MADWMIWLALAGALLILELFSGTFYLLMIAVGLLAGALTAFSNVTVELQLIVAALVGILATGLLRRSRFGKLTRSDASRDPNINLDIGQSIAIEVWEPDVSGSAPRARAMYRGALWDVELSTDGLAGQPGPGRFTIRQVHGSRLIVSPQG